MGTLWTVQSSQPDSLYNKVSRAYGTSYYAISLGTNIILTIFIVVRLFLYRRNLIKHLSGYHARHYVSLAAIIVESAALYSVFALLFLITYAVDDPVTPIFLGLVASTQVKVLLSHCFHRDR